MDKARVSAFRLDLSGPLSSLRPVPVHPAELCDQCKADPAQSDCKGPAQCSQESAFELIQ